MKKIITTMSMLCGITFIHSSPSNIGGNPGSGCNPPPKAEVTVKPHSLLPKGINELTEAVSTMTSKVKYSPIKYERGGDAKLDGEISFKEECCGDKVVPITTIKAEGVIPFGKFSGGAQWPIAPGIVVHCSGSLKLTLKGTVSAKGSCQEPTPINICGSFAGSGTGAFTVGLAIVNPDVISIEGNVSVSVSAGGEWCTKTGLGDKEVCLTVNADISIVTFLGSLPLWNNGGEPLYKDCI